MIWVFGGTCVGKKRFIERCVNPNTAPEYIRPTNLMPQLEPVWINDGPLTEDIVTGYRQGRHFIIRWQWGRDEVLENICRDHPDVRHSISVLSVSLITQLSRIALREGSLKWDAEQVHGEQLNIIERVHELSARYRIPTFYIDASNDDYTLRKAATGCDWLD